MLYSTLVRNHHHQKQQPARCRSYGHAGHAPEGPALAKSPLPPATVRQSATVRLAGLEPLPGVANGLLATIPRAASRRPQGSQSRATGAVSCSRRRAGSCSRSIAIPSSRSLSSRSGPASSSPAAAKIHRLSAALGRSILRKHCCGECAERRNAPFAAELPFSTSLSSIASVLISTRSRWAARAKSFASRAGSTVSMAPLSRSTSCPTPRRRRSKPQMHPVRGHRGLAGQRTRTRLLCNRSLGSSE